ncbi:glycosyltransferase family 4 protein [Brachybacterium huguangmaarense]|uniref:D-inositol 3-phosphate glycosyltransferase n=1 Tax=Brachybacterium huguangmaarense TaxID=1652028 RepID=A0ABY6G235_9MICO|nr:glycosyltransferase family 4 protein [Brachybacterium huguangmaarense]UYG17271.1 glycosyltransferase family 4 protein [Brachybacterium huguangmaarense]
MTVDYQLRYHDGLYQRLADVGWDIHLVSSEGPLGARIAEHPGVTLHVVKMARDPRPLSDLGSLCRWLALQWKIRPAVHVVGTPKAGLLGSLSGFIARTPERIYEIHGLRLESAAGKGRLLLREIEKAVCSMSTRVIAVGSSLRAKVIDEAVAPKGKVEVIGVGSPNGVDVELFERARRDQQANDSLRASLSIPSDEPVVTFVGRLTADKGLEALRKAMATVERETSAQLLIVGGVDDESGRRGAADIRAALPRVTFVGDVEDVASYLAISDVFCLPSRREGLPTVVLEAFAAGVPVVATAATGIVDIVRNGETGRLVPVDDSEELALALLASIRDTAASRQMAEAALCFVKQCYSRDVVQREWVKTLQTDRGVSSDH